MSRPSRKPPSFPSDGMEKTFVFNSYRTTLTWGIRDVMLHSPYLPKLCCACCAVRCCAVLDLNRESETLFGICCTNPVCRSLRHSMRGSLGIMEGKKRRRRERSINLLTVQHVLTRATCQLPCLASDLILNPSSLAPLLVPTTTQSHFTTSVQFKRNEAPSRSLCH